MVIVSSYSLEYNKNKNHFSVVTKEDSVCPYDSGTLVYRDSVYRKLKDKYSEASRYLLRRLRCQICKTLHRELPDLMQPYRHYESSVIQAVLDGGDEAGECCADNRTIGRWKSEFAEAEADIAQRLLSVSAQATNEAVPLKAASIIWHAIKAAHTRWLPFVMSLLICNGHRIRTEFAFRQHPPSDKMAPADKNEAKGGKGIGKTIEDTG